MTSLSRMSLYKEGYVGPHVTFSFSRGDGDAFVEACRWAMDEDGVFYAEWNPKIPLSEAGAGFLKAMRHVLEEHNRNVIQEKPLWTRCRRWFGKCFTTLGFVLVLALSLYVDTISRCGAYIAKGASRLKSLVRTRRA